MNTLAVTDLYNRLITHYVLALNVSTQYYRLYKKITHSLLIDHNIYTRHYENINRYRVYCYHPWWRKNNYVYIHTFHFLSKLDVWPELTLWKPHDQSVYFLLLIISIAVDYTLSLPNKGGTGCEVLNYEICSTTYKVISDTTKEIYLFFATEFLSLRCNS